MSLFESRNYSVYICGFLHMNTSWETASEIEDSVTSINYSLYWVADHLIVSVDFSANMIHFLNNPNASQYWEICGFGFVMGCLGFFKTNSKLPLSAIDSPIIDAGRRNIWNLQTASVKSSTLSRHFTPMTCPIPFIWNVPVLSFLSSMGPVCSSFPSMLCWHSEDQGMQSGDHPMQG